MNECPECHGDGITLTIAIADNTPQWVEGPCKPCDGTGQLTDDERKAYWREHYRARNAPWPPTQYLTWDELDAREDARADAAEAAHAAALEDR